jgi:hypothetical protein
MVDEIRTIPPKLTKTEWNALLDHSLVKSANYIIFYNSTAGLYEALNGTTGKVDYNGTDATTVIQNAINNTTKGKILLKNGVYVLSNPLLIDKSNIHLTGESTGGDLFFTNDPTYHGFSNKIGTVLVANGIDAIHIGENNFVFGVTVENLGINGINSDNTAADNVYTVGAGIRVYKADTIQFKNIQVQRKEKGFWLEPPTPFAYDKVIDIVTMENIYLCFNIYGIYANEWVTSVKMKNIFGYINQKGLIHAYANYDWTLHNIFSNADSWNTPSNDTTNACVYISTYRNVIFENVSIAGEYGTTACPVPLIYLDLNDTGGTATHAYVILNNLYLAETQTDAIQIGGTGGEVRIHEIQAGIRSYYAAVSTPNVAGSIVLIKNTASNMGVYVNGGWVASGQAKYNWFYGLGALGKNIIVKNVKGYNPYGKQTTGTPGIPAFSANAAGIVAYDAGDLSTTPSASTNYTIYNLDMIITSTGGTGVNITIYDPNGNTVASGLTSLTAMYLPVGYKINFGAFTVAPTVTICGV